MLSGQEHWEGGVKKGYGYLGRTPGNWVQSCLKANPVILGVICILLVGFLGGTSYQDHAKYLFSLSLHTYNWDR